MTRTTVRVPSRFTVDWWDSCEGTSFNVEGRPETAARIVKHGDRITTLEAEPAALADLVDRAAHYVDDANDFDPYYRGLIRSAAAVIRAVEKQEGMSPSTAAHILRNATP